jgi:choline dehydrogenase-like flavoprotein
VIIDARRAAPRELDCDICIVGAGAAGLALARQLQGSHRSVCILESGGQRIRAASQALLAGESDDPYPALRAARAAGLGGSTQVWAGWCRPLDPIDFERREEIPHSGWPITLADLQAYYARAHELLQLGPYDYDPQNWERASGLSRWELPRDAIESTLFRQSGVRFAQLYRSAGMRGSGVQLYLNASVTRLNCSASQDHVSSLEVATLNGRRFEVRPRIVVLAAGGIENARLLLLSAPDGSSGPGNARAPVGRYFTEHLYVDAGTYLPAAAVTAQFYLPRQLLRDSTLHTARGALSVAPARQRRERLLNGGMFFRPAYETEAIFEQPQVRAALRVWDVLRSRAVPHHVMSSVAHAASAPLALARAAWSRSRTARAGTMQWRIRSLFECASDPDNRVELGDTRDALGRRVARLHWRPRELDLVSIERSHLILGEALEAAGLGRLRLVGDRPEGWRPYVEPALHHLGTTRMHDDPSQGVVDRNCRVHGIDNLFVAGGSVFPTAGFSNPTLTIVALTLRLGVFLAGRSCH